MVRYVRRIAAIARGDAESAENSPDGFPGIDPETQHTRRVAATRAVAEDYGADRVERVLGDGIKALAASEERNYGYTNRSIHAIRDIPASTVLNEGLIAVLRSEKNLPPGLHPRYWDTILGKRLNRSVEAGFGIRWDDLLAE